jgi:predicted Zn-dependent protease
VGRLDDAAACYRNAIALRPDYAAAHMNLGNLLLQQDRLPEAIRASLPRCISSASKRPDIVRVGSAYKQERIAPSSPA